MNRGAVCSRRFTDTEPDGAVGVATAARGAGLVRREARSGLSLVRRVARIATGVVRERTRYTTPLCSGSGDGPWHCQQVSNAAVFDSPH